MPRPVLVTPLFGTLVETVLASDRHVKFLERHFAVAVAVQLLELLPHLLGGLFLGNGAVSIAIEAEQAHRSSSTRTLLPSIVPFRSPPVTTARTIRVGELAVVGPRPITFGSTSGAIRSAVTGPRAVRSTISTRAAPLGRRPARSASVTVWSATIRPLTFWTARPWITIELRSRRPSIVSTISLRPAETAARTHRTTETSGEAHQLPRIQLAIFVAIKLAELVDDFRQLVAIELSVLISIKHSQQRGSKAAATKAASESAPTGPRRAAFGTSHLALFGAAVFWTTIPFRTTLIPTCNILRRTFSGPTFLLPLFSTGEGLRQFLKRNLIAAKLVEHSSDSFSGELRNLLTAQFLIAISIPSLENLDIEFSAAAGITGARRTSLPASSLAPFATGLGHRLFLLRQGRDELLARHFAVLVLVANPDNALEERLAFFADFVGSQRLVFVRIERFKQLCRFLDRVFAASRHANSNGGRTGGAERQAFHGIPS